jgi:cob(I)alamin adenosyltransferase
MKIDVAKEIEKAQSELDDCNESLSVLDNAVTCGFLFDKHNFAILEWIKEYKKRIKELREFIENARSNG